MVIFLSFAGACEQEIRVQKMLEDQDRQFREQRDELARQRQKKEQEIAKMQADKHAQAVRDLEDEEAKRADLLRQQQAQKEQWRNDRAQAREAAISAALAKNDKQQADKLADLKRKEEEMVWMVLVLHAACCI